VRGVRGEEKITIGTVRTERSVEDNLITEPYSSRIRYSSSEDAAMADDEEDDGLFDQFDDFGDLNHMRRRYGSEETLCSEMSFAASCISLPPPYSQLSSRAESLMSLETCKFYVSLNGDMQSVRYHSYDIHDIYKKYIS